MQLGLVVDRDGIAGEFASDPAYRVTPERTVSLLAQRLASLHEVRAPNGVDVDSSVRWLIACAEHRVLDGSVRADSIGSAYRHLSPQRLLSILRDGAIRAVAGGPLVATHGRPTLDRLACSGGEAVGFVDWTHAAWSDPHRDLAAAAREVAEAFRPILVPVLIAQYREHRPGWSGPDALLLDWYALAAELGA